MCLALAGCSPTGMMAAVIVVTSEPEALQGGSPSLSGPRPPEMAAERKVSEQDCTKPVDYSLGNIRCK